MEQESLHVRYLIVIAAVLCALIIGYNAFYVPDVSLSGITVSTDESSPSSNEEYIPRVPAASGAVINSSSSAASQAARNSSNGKININTATAQQLSDGLDGIGEVMAQRIVDYREKNGGFKSIDQLKNVSGIGDKTFAKLQNSVTIG